MCIHVHTLTVVVIENEYTGNRDLQRIAYEKFEAFAFSHDRIKMTSLVQDRIKMFSFDSSTMEDDAVDAVVPNHEIFGMATSTPTKALNQNGLRTKTIDSSTMEDDAVVPNDEMRGMATSTPTKALKQNSLRTKTIDSSTMEDDAIVPHDEMRGMATATKALKQNGLRTKTKIPPDQHQRQRQHHRFTNRKHLSGTSIEKPREIIAYPTDDDHRFTNRKHLSVTSIEKPREIIAYPIDDDHRFTSRKHLSVTSIEKPREIIAYPTDEIIASPTDDEDRIPPPPPMEIVTNSSTNHPDFEAWKRDMTETLFTGTVMTSLMKSPKTTVQRTDWQTTRLNRRRLEKKWLQQQLRSVKSDTSTTTESESGGDEDSSLQSGYSSTFLHIRTDDRKSSESKPRSGHVRTDARKSSESKPRSRHDIDIHTVYIPNQPEDTENTNIHVGSLPQTIPAPLSPRSLAMERPTMSAQEAPLSPNAQPNSKDLAEIMVELADLKTWAEGVENRLRKSTSTPPSSPMVELAGLKTWAEGVEDRLRQSTPPSSPKPHGPPANLTTEAVTKVTTEAATKGLAQKDASLPKSIEVPQLLPTPKSIIVPQLHEPGKKYTSMIERRVFSKEKGIPTMLTIQTIATESKFKTQKEHVKKAIKQNKKKGVRFTKPLITDTKYRPKTRREDVDALFFQEEELLDWENDEETTLNDRFEVVATEFGNQVLHQGNEKDEEEDKRSTGKLSIGTPLISFHTSYSNSFQDSSDEESFNSC